MSNVQPFPELYMGLRVGLGVSELIVEVGQSWRTAATARYPWIWDPANLLIMRIMMILIMMATIYDDQENFWRCNSKFEGICVKKYDLSLIGVVVTLLLVSVCFGHSASTNTWLWKQTLPKDLLAFYFAQIFSFIRVHFYVLQDKRIICGKKFYLFRQLLSEKLWGKEALKERHPLKKSHNFFSKQPQT